MLEAKLFVGGCLLLIMINITMTIDSNSCLKNWRSLSRLHLHEESPAIAMIHEYSVTIVHLTFHLFHRLAATPCNDRATNCCFCCVSVCQCAGVSNKGYDQRFGHFITGAPKPEEDPQRGDGAPAFRHTDARSFYLLCCTTTLLGTTALFFHYYHTANHLPSTLWDT